MDKKPNILVVEDDSDNRAAIVRVLQMVVKKCWDTICQKRMIS